MTSVLQKKQENLRENSKSDENNLTTNDSLSKNNQKPSDVNVKGKSKYNYNYTYIPSIAMLDKLPLTEYPSMAWIDLVAEESTTILINNWVLKKGKIFQIFRNQVVQNVLKFIVKVIAKWVIYPLVIIIGFIKNNKFLNLIYNLFLNQLNFSSLILKFLFSHQSDTTNDKSDLHVNSLQEYNELFQEIKLPDIAHDFQEDDVFAYMQVAGYNPLMIERVKPEDKLLEKFPVTEAQYQEVMGDDDSLKAAMKEGRLYLADYQIFKGAPNGTFPEEQKYIYAPLALFAVPKTIEASSEHCDSSRLMRPVAIQCTQNPKDELLFTPKSEKYKWLFAKTIVHVADANFHEALSHLGRTHLFIGRFAIAIHRTLSENHPLRLLLLPHFKGTSNINNLAQESLVAPGGGVDELLSSTIDASRALVEADLQNYSFNDAMLTEELKKRGVDDKNKLPVYPYRDDAILIWDAIREWVKDYLDLYYENDREVQNDEELQNWAIECKAYDGARVPGFGEDEDGRIKTLEYLIKATTLIIFTASAQHAAVNFPQKDIMTYAPAVPLAGYQPLSVLKDKDKDKVTEQDYLNLLPPLKQAKAQLSLLYLLGSVYYTQLGDYPQNHFKNPRVKPVLEKFHQNLWDVETKIINRNRIGFTYEYLLPSKIPQSINI